MSQVPQMKNVESDNVGKILQSALDAGQGLLRLTPTWVPRSFLHPGKRIRLHPDDYYALGAERGGIDERWFSSTTEAANDGRLWHEGLSFCQFEDQQFLLRDAVAEAGAALVGADIWERFERWPVYSKFFDNMGPIPHHMHQSQEDAALVGREGKPEAYYFPPQYNNCDNHFPHTFMGLEPGTTQRDLRRCLENWNSGDNGILDLSKAYRLKRGTGLVDSSRRSSRSRIVMYLRTPVGKRCFWDVPEYCGRPVCSLGPVGERRAGGQAAGSRFHYWATRLGKKYRPGIQGQ